MASRSLVFVETVKQIEFLKTTLPNQKSNVYGVLSPFVRKYCEDHRLDHVTVKECFEKEAYQKAHLESENRINFLREILNNYSRKIGKDKLDFPLELGNYFTGLLLPSLGSLHYRSYLLKSMIEKVGAEHLIAFEKTSPVHRPLGMLYSPSDGTFAKLLRSSPYSSISSFYEDPEQSRALKYQFKDKLRELSPVHDFYELHKNKFPIKNIGEYFLSKALNLKSKILFVGSLYQFSQLLPNLYGGDFRIYWGDKIPVETSKEDFDFSWTDRFCDFNVSEIYRDRLQVILQSLELCCRDFHSLFSLVQSSDLVLSSCFLFPLQQMVGHIAKTLEKPVLVWTHGSKGITKSLLSDESNDLIYSDCVMTYGSGVNDYYKKYFPAYNKTRYEAIGSNSDKQFENEKAQDYILYVTGKYLLNMANFTEIGGADDILYSSQKDILEYLKKQRHLPVVWKQNPTAYMGDVPFDSKGIEVVRYEKTFLTLLEKAALVIFDSPSTAAVEAAMGTKPLFLLMKRIEYLSPAMDLVKKRAVVSTSVQELMFKVDSYLKEGTYEADLQDRSFARAYSVHLDDGKSSERALHTVEKCLNPDFNVLEKQDCIEDTSFGL